MGTISLGILSIALVVMATKLEESLARYYPILAMQFGPFTLMMKADAPAVADNQAAPSYSCSPYYDRLFF
jgi:hypothetical protein